MKTKWENQTLDLLDAEFHHKLTDEYEQNIQTIFNEKGKEGWELAALIPVIGYGGHGIASHSMAIFKRSWKDAAKFK